MKAVFMILSLLLFYFLICSATTRPDPEDANTEIPHNVTKQRDSNSSSENWALGKFPGDFSNSIGQETALGSEYIGCAVNSTSPTERDVNNATKIVADKGYQSCVLGDSNSPRCNLLAAGGSAKIYFCGHPGVRITCSDLVDTILALVGMCAKTVGGESRVRGTVALFPGGDMLDSSKLSFITIVSSGEDRFFKYL